MLHWKFDGGVDVMIITYAVNLTRDALTKFLLFASFNHELMDLKIIHI